MINLLILAAALLAASAHSQAAETEEQLEETVETVVKQADREVVKADTLWDLAKFFYKDPFQWPRIYEANKHQIKDPHWIYPDQILIIPGFERSVRVVKTTSKERAMRAPPVPAPVPPSAPAPVETPAPSYRPDRAPGSIPVPEALSTRLPEGMTAGEPSVYRMLMPKGWDPKIKIVPFAGREAIAAEGDEVYFEPHFQHALKVRKGMRFTVWRRSAPTEADLDQKGVYAQKIGVVEAVKRVGKTQYRAVVVRSGGPVLVDDLLTPGE
ncbi:MAG: LysM peptidoglycan-binding domain-containing protein [Elusimicrobia bacterium]|nr:LysM peptidoglycan-binding domain-containing protein [Elusimicrobiota bacterium]